MERVRFGEEIEKRARRVVERSGQSDSSIVRGVRDELSLALSELDDLRAFAERQRRDLLRVECYVDTELMHMEARTPRYSPYRFPEREKLQRRLFSIHQERSQQERIVFDREAKLVEKLQALQLRLNEISF